MPPGSNETASEDSGAVHALTAIDADLNTWKMLSDGTTVELHNRSPVMLEHGWTIPNHELEIANSDLKSSIVF